MKQPRSDAERKAIERARDCAAQADITLAVFDASRPLRPADKKLLAQLDAKAALAVLNKIDLGCRVRPESVRPLDFVYTSLATGAGLPQLREKLEARLAGLAETEYTCVITERQRQLASAALTSVKEAASLLAGAGQAGLAPAATLLAEALEQLARLTGETWDDAVLDAVFAKFCIGK